MRNVLHLSGDELWVYAIIFQMSQDGASEYCAGNGYIREWLDCTENTAAKYLKQLTEKGFIEKHEQKINGVKFCNYTANLAVVPQNLRWGDTSKIEDINEVSISNDISTSKRDNNISKPQKFNFRAELIKIGVSPDTADQWLEVRKVKKAVNTKIAFKDIATEMAKVGGVTTEIMAQFAVRRSWAGFKAEWYINATKPENETRPQPAHENYLEHNRRVAEELQRQYQQADEQF